MQGVCIIGTRRSGSNLLRLILHQHPEIVAPHPPHFLTHFSPHLSAYRGQAQPLLLDMLALLKRNLVPWPGPIPSMERILQEVPEAGLSAIMMAIYAELARANGASCWVNKSLAHVHHLDALEYADQRIKYIYLYRDPRAVVASFQQIPVGPKHPILLAQKWVQEQKIALNWQKKTEPDRFFSLSYEKLIHDPGTSLEPLFQFIGHEFDPNFLTFNRSVEASHTASAGQMWANVANPIQRHPKVQLDESSIRWVEQICGELMQTLGYALTFPIEKQALPDIQRVIRQDTQLRQAAFARLPHSEKQKRKALQRFIDSLPTPTY
ncbi:MAG: sulfotransferase [Bacteroidota bacterium]